MRYLEATFSVVEMRAKDARFTERGEHRLSDHVGGRARMKDEGGEGGVRSPANSTDAEKALNSRTLVSSSSRKASELTFEALYQSRQQSRQSSSLPPVAPGAPLLSRSPQVEEELPDECERARLIGDITRTVISCSSSCGSTCTTPSSSITDSSWTWRSSASAGLASGATAWTTPQPSRTTMNAYSRCQRTACSQPWTRTRWPTRAATSLDRTRSTGHFRLLTLPDVAEAHPGRLSSPSGAFPRIVSVDVHG